MPSRSRPDRGMVKLRCETLNQDDKPVQVLVCDLVVQRRPPTATQTGDR